MKRYSEEYQAAVQDLENLLQPVVGYLDIVDLRERDVERVLRRLSPVKRMQRELDILFGLHSREKRLRKCWMYTACAQAVLLAMMLVIAIIR